MRTLIDIPEEMAHALNEMGAKRRTSRARLVREAIQEYLSRRNTRDLNAAFGLWGKRTADGVAWQRKIRAEW
jgi:metal-responsive CopG/Arc/MetJ family transcriptional regulator